MKRSLFTFAILMLVTLASLCAAEAKLDRPNIVVFLVDDMGVMDTSVAFLTDEQGNPKRYPLNDFYRTPNMVRLANKGVRFNNFYAMSVCSPTRSRQAGPSTFIFPTTPCTRRSTRIPVSPPITRTPANAHPLRLSPR